MKNYCFVALLIIFGLPASGQTISVDGEVTKPVALSVADIDKLPSVEVKAKDKDGKEHSFRGANLFAVVQSAGIPASNKSFVSYIEVSAADNYKAIFTLAEIDPAFASQAIVLATSVDGKPLPKGEGPFRVVVPGDKKHARWVREVTRIRLVTVK